MKLRFNLFSFSGSRFLNSYERHIILIYVIYIILFSSVLFVDMLVGIPQFPAYAQFVGFAIVAVFHAVVNINQSKKERYPYQLLYHQHVKAWFFLITTICLFALIPIFILITVYLSEQPFYPLIAQILDMLSPLLISFMLSSSLFVMPQFSNHKEARLCFRLSLQLFEKVPTKGLKRAKIANKNLRWFKRAFRSCNAFLVYKPYSLELKDLDRYHNAIYTAMLLGSSSEVKRMSKHIESLLSSIGRKESAIELREFLIALRSVVGKTQKKKKESLIELSDMWKTSSKLERLKSRIKSPVTVSIVAIVTLIITVFALLFQTFKG